MKIALAQVNPTIGAFADNVAKLRSMVQEAREGGAELVVFPELAISGYPPRDLLEKPSFIDHNLDALESLQTEAKGIAILVGHIARNERAGAKPLFNAASLLVDGALQQSYHKRLLPSYDVFDEARYFAMGQEPGVFSHLGERFGVTICEDIWNDKQFWEKPSYAIDPVSILMQQDISFIINLAASPYGWDKEVMRLEMMQALAKRNQCPIYFCNLVGGNDELVFDGASCVVNAQGALVAEAKRFEEDLLQVDTREDLPAIKSSLDEDPLEGILQALRLGLRDYTHKCGFEGVVLGLSGGIDSALTAVLAVDALGPSNVVGLIMPSRYTSQESIVDAQQLADTIGLTTQVISIEPVFEQYLGVLQPWLQEKKPDHTEENLQARIRGNFLMAFSNKYGHLVLSTGNKSELSVGYCTLYGDMSGGLALISDIPKTLVYRLCELINRNQERIPRRIIERPPSAELKANQTDQDTLPPYEVLDPILKLFIEDHQGAGDIVAQGFDHSIVEDAIYRVVSNEYKRQQMPIGIKVSKKAFGIGRRQPLAKKR